MEETITTPSSGSVPASTAPSSSPAPSTPSSPTTDRPSFGEALDTFNSIRETQGQSTRGRLPAAAQSDGATIPPAAVQATPVPAKPAGPIPFEVHSKALENARLKERTAVEQEYRQKYGDVQNLELLRPYAEGLASGDRTGFLTSLINEALQDPQLAPQVMSLAGRTLSGSRAPQVSEPPAPDFTDGQGNQFFSARTQQAREEWLTAKIKAEILGEVQPHLDQVETVTQREQQREAQQQQTQWRDATLSEARAQPYFKEHEAEIKQAYLRMPATSGHPAEEARALQKAYIQVVLPKISQLKSDEMLASLKSRATASTLNPASTGVPGGVPKSVRAKDGGSMREALRWADAQTGGR